jgi:undecaprenyl-phosphate 4-deoxy-4-formamido-L-arabinose transferase
MELSVVVPVYRSAKNAVAHLPQIVDALRHKYRKFEVLFIIDYHDMNSEMDSFIFLCEKYSEIKIHALNKNYGQHFATLCGYYLAKGDFIACVDEDMSAYLLEICKTNNYKNFDVFYFYYNKNEMYNSPIRKFFSILYKLIISKMVNLGKHSTFRIISKQLRDKILIEKHYYWNLDVMIFDNTKNVGGITILNCSITDEDSNYNYKKLLKIAFEIAYEHNTILMNILLAILPALSFFIVLKDVKISILFYATLVLISSGFYKIIKLKTKTTTEKINTALK